MLSHVATTKPEQEGGKGTIRLEVARRGVSLYNATAIEEIHGFTWTAWTCKTGTANEEFLSVGISNNKTDESNCWFADATVMMYIKNHKGSAKDMYKTLRQRFHQNTPSVHLDNLIIVDQFLDDSGYFDPVSDLLVITIELRVSSFHGSKFLKRLSIDWSDEVSGCDVCLVVGGRKFYLAKHMLVRHTRHFESMFFGSWKEREMDEIALHDLDPDNFKLFLNFIHGASGASMNRNTVLGLLELAHRFGADAVLTAAEAYLWTTADFQLNEILVLTDRFMLPALKDHLLTSMNSVQELQGAVDHYDDYTPDTHKILSEKLAKKMAEQEHELEFFRRQAARGAAPQYNNNPFAYGQQLQSNNFPQHNNQYMNSGPPGFANQQPGPSGLNNQGIWNPPGYGNNIQNPLFNQNLGALNFPMPAAANIPPPPVAAPRATAARKPAVKRARKAAANVNAAGINAVIAAVAAGAGALPAAPGNNP